MDNITKRFLTYKWQIICVLLPLVLGFLVPSTTDFIARISVSNLSINQAFAEVFNSQFAEGENLFMLAIIGLIPFIALALFLIFQVTKNKIKACFFVCTCGIIGILSLMVPTYYSYWKAVYVGRETSSTGVLVFIFVPIFCLVPLVISVIIGKLITYKIWGVENTIKHKSNKNLLAIVAITLTVLGFLDMFYMEYLCCIMGLLLAIFVLLQIRKNKLLGGKNVAIAAVSIGLICICYNISILCYGIYLSLR